MRRLIAAPFVLAGLAVLVSFALSNAQTVPIGLWPTGLSIALPLSVAILTGMAVAFLAGALMLWVTAIAARRRARHAEDRARMLQAQLDAAARTTPELPPPA